MTTVTTVGYGDHFPVTPRGRVVAGGLMLAGIALLGAVTATFASWLIEKVAAVEEASASATRQDIEELTAQVQALRQELQARDASHGRASPRRDPAGTGAGAMTTTAGDNAQSPLPSTLRVTPNED